MRFYSGPLGSLLFGKFSCFWMIGRVSRRSVSTFLEELNEQKFIVLRGSQEGSKLKRSWRSFSGFLGILKDPVEKTGTFYFTGSLDRRRNNQTQDSKDPRWEVARNKKIPVDILGQFPRKSKELLASSRP